MYQKFHQYYKDTNIKIVFKYDGERQKHVFTVMVIDKDNPNNSLSRDTDNPYVVFQEFLNTLNIIVTDEINKNYFDFFLDIKMHLERFIHSELIFILSSELNDEIEYYISIMSQDITTNYRSCDIKKLYDFIEDLR